MLVKIIVIDRKSKFIIGWLAWAELGKNIETVHECKCLQPAVHTNIIIIGEQMSTK